MVKFGEAGSGLLRLVRSVELEHRQASLGERAGSDLGDPMSCGDHGGQLVRFRALVDVRDPPSLPDAAHDGVWIGVDDHGRIGQVDPAEGRAGGRLHVIDVQQQAERAVQQQLVVDNRLPQCQLFDHVDVVAGPAQIHQGGYLLGGCQVSTGHQCDQPVRELTPFRAVQRLAKSATSVLGRSPARSLGASQVRGPWPVAASTSVVVLPAPEGPSSLIRTGRV